MCTLCSDLIDSVHDKNSVSRDQARFIDLVSDSIRHCDNSHYEIALPLRNIQLPYNRSAAERRIQFLKQRFIKNEELYNDYKVCMQRLITSGHVENVESTKGQKGKTWFIPHHGVYHKDKPGKIRVVFDCSAKFKGICLNNCQYQGPELNNNLLGVPLQFRRKSIAIQADVESMFHQIQIAIEDRDLMHFLWWKDRNIENERSKPEPVSPSPSHNTSNARARNRQDRKSKPNNNSHNQNSNNVESKINTEKSMPVFASPLSWTIIPLPNR